MSVRVDQLVPYGYTDSRIATFHAFGDSLIREYALDLGLPPDVRVLSRAEVVIFLREHLYAFDLDRYRPLGDPTRFLAALATLFSRCKDEDIEPRTLRRPRRADAGRGGGAGPAAGAAPDGAAAEVALTPGRAGRRLRHLPATAGRERLHRLRRPGRARAAAAADLAGDPGRRSPQRFRYVLVDEFQDTNRCQAELVALLTADAPQRDRRRRRRPGDLRLPRGGDRQHPRLRRSLSRAPGRSSCGGTTGRSAPILDAAVPADPVQRPGPPRGAGRDRQAPPPGADAIRTAAPVRVEAFATGSDEADWIAADIAPPHRRPGRDRATTPCSCARTSTPTRSCGRSTSPASRGGSPARPGCMPDPRSGCCWPSCAPSPTRTRASTSTRSPPPRCTASAART